MNPLPVLPAGHPGAVGVGTVVTVVVEGVLVVLGSSHFTGTLVEVAVGAGVLTHRGAMGFNSVLHTS